MRRGAYFFVLDAFIAGIIIISTITVIFGSFAVADDSRQSYSLAETLMTFLETTELQSYGGDSRFTLSSNPEFDSSLTILEQIVHFYNVGGEDNEHAAEVLLNDTMKLAPSNAGSSFSIIEDVGTPKELYHDNSFVETEDARLQVVSQRVVIVSGTPYVVEVRVWR